MKNQMKYPTQMEISKVLLVCVFNKNSTIITHDIFYKLFSKYGQVQKILIFDKNRIWKVFVEMENEQEAEIAKSNLDGDVILQDGSKMNVYYSNLQQVSFHNSNSGGVDYQVLKKKITNFKNMMNANSQSYIPTPFQSSFSEPESTLIKKSFPLLQEETNFSNENRPIQINLEQLLLEKKENDYELSSSPFGSQSTEAASIAKPNPINLSESLKKLDIILKKNDHKERKSIKIEKDELDKLVPRKCSFKEKIEKIEKIEEAKDDESPLLQTKKLLFKPTAPALQQMFGDWKSFDDETNDGVNEINMQKKILEAQNQLFDPDHIGKLDPATYINPLFVIENRKSKVIYCGGMESEDITMEYIYNLFSNFGDITKMIWIKKKKTCLIEYESINYSSYAREYLNNMVFFNNPLKIFFSNYKEISIDLEKEISGDEIYIGKEESFRMKSNKIQTINPPTETIHISNLKKEACSYDIILGIFGQYGKIEGIKFIYMEKFKNMCLIKYATIEESIQAVTHMHQKEVYGRKVQISFTRSKL